MEREQEGGRERELLHLQVSVIIFVIPVLTSQDFEASWILLLKVNTLNGHKQVGPHLIFPKCKPIGSHMVGLPNSPKYYRYDWVGRSDRVHKTIKCYKDTHASTITYDLVRPNLKVSMGSKSGLGFNLQQVKLLIRRLPFGSHIVDCLVHPKTITNDWVSHSTRCTKK
jgi:hypothetical protein